MNDSKSEVVIYNRQKRPEQLEELRVDTRGEGSEQTEHIVKSRKEEWSTERNG